MVDEASSCRGGRAVEQSPDVRTLRLYLISGLAALTLVSSGSAYGLEQDATAPASNARAESYHQFMLGRQLNGAGEIEAAIAAYRLAAELAPESAEVLGELAELFAQQGRVDEAIQTAERALELAPDNTQGHWVLGNVYAAFAEQPGGGTALGGSPEAAARRALGHLEQARQPLSYNPGLELRVGRLQLQLGDYDAAIQTLEALADRVPESPDVVLSVADAYEAADRSAEAIARLEQLLQLRPSSRASSRLAGLYERQERWSDAAAAYRSALSRRPDSQTLKLRLARALLSGGEALEARDQLRGLVAQDDIDPAALSLLVRAELVLHDFAAAEAAARRLTEVEPDTLRGVYALTEVFQRQHQPQRIVDTLTPVLNSLRVAADQTPDLVRLLVQVGFAELGLGRPDRAVPLFEEARETSPGSVTLDIYTISAYVAAGRYAEALEGIERAKASGNDDLRLTRLEARALAASGEADRGITLMTEALEQHGQDPAAHLALAGLYVEAQRLDEAARVLQSAGETFPDDLSIGFQLGAVLEQQERYGDAEEAFLRVLSDDPAHAPALNYLGYMLAERGERLEASVDYVQRALEIDPGNGAYRDSLGWAFYKLNRLEEASEQLERASEQLQTNSVIQDHFGQVLFGLERYDEAIVAWRRALDGDGEGIDRGELERKIRDARERSTAPRD